MLINLDPFKTVETLGQLNQCFKAICNQQGIEHFALVDIVHCVKGNERQLSVHSTYPDTWVQQYLNGNYHEFDPVLVSSKQRYLPFYWDNKSFKNMTLKQRQLFVDAYDFGIKSGTTIPLMPNSNKYSYLTILDSDKTYNFDLMFYLRAAGDVYFKKRNKILGFTKNILLDLETI